MTFGAFISAKRKELRLTLRETAKHLGIACGYLSDVEQSRRPAPEGDFVERISRYLDLSKTEYSAQDCAPRPLELSTCSGGIEQSRRWR